MRPDVADWKDRSNIHMQQFVEVFIGGISQGAVYCVFALGLSLVYGIARIMNLAHGSFYMMGAYIAWVLSTGYLGFSYPIVFVILIPILFILGLGIEWIIIRPLREKPNWKITTMMVTLGLAFVLDNFSLILFGSEDKLLPPFVQGTVSFHGLVFSYHRILVFFTAIGIVAALELFLGNSRYGRAMRAVAQDMQGASMVGINVNQIFSMRSGYPWFWPAWQACCWRPSI